MHMLLQPERVVMLELIGDRHELIWFPAGRRGLWFWLI